MNEYMIPQLSMKKMSSLRKKVIAIVGPTASGKTALSINLARHVNGEIISADSRQVYRNLDIGTEKIKPDEMRGIFHHLLDVVEPSDVFSVAEFKRLAEQALEEIHLRGNIPIIVGGAGFYIQSLLQGLVIPQVLPNESLRCELTKKSIEKLYTMLKEKDPRRAATIEAKNPRRLIRALEIVEATGKVPPLQFTVVAHDVLYIGIEVNNDELKQRIAARLDSQLERGLLKEVAELLTQVSRQRLNEFGYEYRLTAEHLEGKITLDEMRERLGYELWHYAKRQRSWFKQNKQIHWFKLAQEKEIRKLVESFLRKTSVQDFSCTENTNKRE